MTLTVGTAARSTPAARYRWCVHLALLATVTVSLVLEPLLTVHIALGLVFVGLVVVHLVQRRRVSLALARRLPRVASWGDPRGAWHWRMPCWRY